MKDRRWKGWNLTDMMSLESTIKWVVTTIVIGLFLSLVVWTIYQSGLATNQKNIAFLQEAKQLCPKGIVAYVQDYMSDHPIVVCK